MEARFAVEVTWKYRLMRSIMRDQRVMALGQNRSFNFIAGYSTVQRSAVLICNSANGPVRTIRLPA
jgi:hypothetical protein